MPSAPPARRFQLSRASISAFFPLALFPGERFSVSLCGVRPSRPMKATLHSSSQHILGMLVGHYVVMSRSIQKILNLKTV